LIDRFTQSRILQKKSHQLIPGGAHTYAKGDDQFPVLAPGFIQRGAGCHVWDVDGNEYIEYGMGCRAVTLGHAFTPIIEAVQSELIHGTNFSRPAPLEVQCAEELLSMVPYADMCKFSKNGSDATTAAIKLARAATGRDLIAICQDHPFFSIDDWFIGTTAIGAGIPKSTIEQTKFFRYNDADSLKTLLETYPEKIAAVILEPAKYSDPEADFLHQVKRLCESNGVIFILDEMITGFRWANGGAQEYYDIEPDLSTFGKALANGFSLSALLGKQDLMERGGIYHDKQRVFLLSTTHGAETHSLAAGIATMKFYQENPVVETLAQQGAKLKSGLIELIESKGLSDYVRIIGKPCNLVFVTLDADQKSSQDFRTLLMQELIKHGVIGTSLVVSYSHSDDDIEKTINAFREALLVYAAAIERGVGEFLHGRPTQTVYQTYSTEQYQSAPTF